MLPSTNIKNHRITFVNSEYRDPLPITELKAEAIKRFLRDKGAQFIDITDDNGNYSETIKKSSIKGVEKIIQANSAGDRRWICDYGTRHRMTDSSCDCIQKFNVHFLDFRGWLRKKYNQAFNYAADITPEMQQEFLRENTNGF